MLCNSCREDPLLVCWEAEQVSSLIYTYFHIWMNSCTLMWPSVDTHINAKYKRVDQCSPIAGRPEQHCELWFNLIKLALQTRASKRNIQYLAWQRLCYLLILLCDAISCCYLQERRLNNWKWEGSATYSEMYSRKDSNFGWLIVAASFLSHFFQYGIVWTVGVFYVIFLEHIGGSSGAVALISSLNTAMFYSTGNVIDYSIYIQKLNFRRSQVLQTCIVPLVSSMGILAMRFGLLWCLFYFCHFCISN